jgi:hypothetical protein
MRQTFLAHYGKASAYDRGGQIQIRIGQLINDVDRELGTLNNSESEPGS